MKRKPVVGLIAIVAIVAVVIFAGCVEEPTPTPMPTTPTYTPEPTVTPTPMPTETPTPTLPQSAVTITALEEGDTVLWREFVEGTSEGVYGSELNIYVLIYPIEVGGPWWVQPDVDLSHDGRWDVNCYFGRNPETHPQDRGARFRVCAIITTQKLSEGQQWQKLPDYIVKSETIEVIRG